jgi:hypothetical protein
MLLATVCPAPARSPVDVRIAADVVDLPHRARRSRPGHRLSSELARPGRPWPGDGDGDDSSPGASQPVQEQEQVQAVQAVQAVQEQLRQA